MAICVIAENPKLNAETFDQLIQKLRAGDFPPEGMIFQVAGAAEGIWRVLTVWKSRDHFDRFKSERLAKAWAEVGVNRDDVTFTIFETHTMVAGDLSAVPQPAMTGAAR
jgi:hypothetical protein